MMIEGKMSRETLLESIVKLWEIINENSIKILYIAKTKELNDILWEEILDQIRNSLLGISTKLIICYRLITVPETEKRKDIIEEAHS